MTLRETYAKINGRAVHALYGGTSRWVEMEYAEWLEALVQEHANLTELSRCPVMLPNRHSEERCGREVGHDGNHCCERGD
mgnify:CR=1 FL=1